MRPLTDLGGFTDGDAASTTGDGGGGPSGPADSGLDGGGALAPPDGGSKPKAMLVVAGGSFASGDVLVDTGTTTSALLLEDGGLGPWVEAPSSPAAQSLATRIVGFGSSLFVLGNTSVTSSELSRDGGLGAYPVLASEPEPVTEPEMTNLRSFARADASIATMRSSICLPAQCSTSVRRAAVIRVLTPRASRRG